MLTVEDGVSSAGSWSLGGDLMVRRMGFGTMRITVHRDRSRAVALLRRAIELGINHLDTAAFYVSPGGTLGVGTGSPRWATDLIREALWPYPNDLVIATKVGPGEEGWARTPSALRSQVVENLRRLGRDHLDVVNLRLTGPGHGTLADEFGALAEMRAEGLIRHLGLSAATLDHVDEAQTIAPVVCLQNSYGLDYRRQHDEVVRVCGERDIAFVPFFTLAGTAREQGATTEANAAVQAAARARGATTQQVRLAWALQQGPHMLVIPGTGSVAHLEENVAAGGLRLSPQELAELGSTGS
ncbi:aldo/keto reductase [Nocardioides sp. zg-1228]|uniref:aldo/keto reductase n=1 Tax=Nocardioides sp. zg-1228 TaxID=2763008 RepID=UPI0016435BDE|nr:aldo/keto reductase [Nocardioides sp. zg-1228]MBC2934396.1 aldo/keto reductase [Nocardioides sp. zg-1228]QSF59165.1 aldo/keto reductase [Nocardioides sp. zg-1228]